MVHAAAGLQAVCLQNSRVDPALLCSQVRMNFRLFYHSLLSDWNHGNAHFLRGVMSELLARGHDVRVFEPRAGWSRTNLLQQHPSALTEFRRSFPRLMSEDYDVETFDVEAALDDADVVIVHEWTDPVVLERVTEHRTRQGKYGLLFHDTHHRAVSDPESLPTAQVERMDAVLAFGSSLAGQYRRLGWGRRVFSWHEAADTRVFTPRLADTREGELVWIGNWGDDERVQELNEFLIEPVSRLGLKARVHGVRYPPDALARLAGAGIEYGGWVPNADVPEVFARFQVTMHVPRAPYVAMLPGIPTIRVFEALACGIPLVSAPWDDCEALFRPGDFVMVHTGDEMAAALQRILRDADYAADLRARGLATIQERHTCAHRVDELFAILEQLGIGPRTTHDETRALAPIQED